ncbi:unnamed protein product [Dicrocoelium dendriticum]|nr:unnamed protein product [Dicrocoelium dendriticum]
MHPFCLGSVDVWNDKVIRAGMSAHFRVPIFHNLSWSDIAQRICCNGSNSSTTDSDHPIVYAADTACSLTDRLLRNAIDDKTESYRYAATLSDNADEEVAVGDIPVNVPIAFRRFLSNPSPVAYRLPLPACPHFSLDYFDHRFPRSNSSQAPKMALVVGSEAEGLSMESYYLTHLTGGCRVIVPSSPDTESLNAASAVSIILGEMQRQYLQLSI